MITDQWNGFDLDFSAAFKNPLTMESSRSSYGSYLPDLTNVQNIHMPILQIVNTHCVMEHAEYSPLCLCYLSI
jgi:hypothetical protein